MGTLAWYVIQSKPHKENQVCAYLEAQDFEVFFPTFRVQQTGSRAAKPRPFFPRYMFVHTDLDEVGTSALQWLPGAIGLVQFDECPATVPDTVVHQLKQRVEAIDTGGLIFEDLKPGDLVRIINGPLAGYDAIFDLRLNGSERVQVLLTLLGRLVRMQISANDIEKRRGYHL
ncbi:transcription termination/antitermination protein NusG [Aggregatilinea lenta]|uniref:transcription termination/antitermination protein NusG n=1 Tax=Aggregatilinea lenta TaxID=913108 RepID=UPI000E5BE901|nr:transcription termination/antitermination NusG family protein [Aggregatilinea lenta]